MACFLWALVRSLANSPHDLHLLKTADAVLQALDSCAAKLRDCKGNANANITFSFCPVPAIRTSHALHARVKAMGIKLCDKSNECMMADPKGIMGGQQGQPSVAIMWANSHKVTIQVHARKGTVVLKGRKAAYAHEVLRMIVPFLGLPTSVASNAKETCKVSPNCDVLHLIIAAGEMLLVSISCVG